MSLDLSCGLKYGRSLRRRSAGGVTLSEAAYSPGSVIPPHCHGAVQLSLVLDGGYEERVGATTLYCEAGILLLHRPGSLHSDHFSDEGGRCLNVSLSDDLLRDAREVDGGPDDWPSIRQGIPSRYAFELRQLLWAADPPSAEDVEEVALTLVDRFVSGPALEAPSSPPRWLRRVRRRVHAEFPRRPSLASLAAEAGVHKTHVARAFRRHFGCTVGDYVRRRRVEFACRRLVEGSPDLGAVAYAAGFADQAHFTREFGRLVGLTPGAFRRRFADRRAS